MEAEPDVRYGLEVLGDTIPGREGRVNDGNSRYSPLRDQIDKIREDERLYHKWIAIADYGSGSVAGGAMRDLKHHYGEIPEISGMTFTTHRYAVKNDDDDEVKRDKNDRIVKRCKLVARYDPEKISPERRRQWERNQIMARGREAARKLGIDVDKVEPERRDPENDGTGDYVPGMRLPRP